LACWPGDEGWRLGVVVDLILGILGGLLGGWVFGLLGIWQGGGMIDSIIVAFVGAVILVSITGCLARRGNFVLLVSWQTNIAEGES
jgi:uncharacterized membrane protein YeaQ/YmgE (transglycosylase-associated protein family)